MLLEVEHLVKAWRGGASLANDGVCLEVTGKYVSDPALAFGMVGAWCLAAALFTARVATRLG